MENLSIRPMEYEPSLIHMPKPIDGIYYLNGERQEGKLPISANIYDKPKEILFSSKNAGTSGAPNCRLTTESIVVDEQPCGIKAVLTEDIFDGDKKVRTKKQELSQSYFGVNKQNSITTPDGRELRTEHRFSKLRTYKHIDVNGHITKGQVGLGGIDRKVEDARRFKHDFLGKLQKLIVDMAQKKNPKKFGQERPILRRIAGIILRIK